MDNKDPVTEQSTVLNSVPKCSAIFCDKFYVRADISEGKFGVTPNITKINVLKKR